MKSNFKISLFVFAAVFLINNVLWYKYSEKINTFSTYPTVEKDSIISRNSNPYHNVDFEKFKKDVILNGDTKAYSSLFGYLADDQLCPDYTIFWSLIMANKYNYDVAHFLVFQELAYIGYLDENNYFNNVKINDTLSYISLDHLDSITRNIALDHLVKASEMNIQNAKSELGAYYIAGNYFPKNVEFGKKLIAESKVFK